MPAHAGLPCWISSVSVAFGFDQAAMSRYFSTNRSLTILPKTTLPQSFKCVLSSSTKLYAQLASGPISSQYASLAPLRSIQRAPRDLATAIVALRSLARFSTIRGGVPENCLLVSGVTRIGVPFAERTSFANCPRLVEYSDRLMFLFAFWSLWPN